MFIVCDYVCLHQIPVVPVKQITDTSKTENDIIYCINNLRTIHLGVQHCPIKSGSSSKSKLLPCTQ